MKTLTYLIPLLIACYPAFAQEKFEPVAVIELFTSQGCSSCPPADELLTETLKNVQQTGKKVIGLSYHVSYWDYLGWKDPFTNEAYNQRQKVYDQQLNSSTYTPQMVVNGQTTFVGSNKASLEASLQKTLNTKSIAQFTSLKATANNKGTITVAYSLAGNYKGCQIHLALVSLMESTAVKRGENEGRQLAESNVVRQLIDQPATENGTATLTLSPGMNGKNWAVIAFLQQPNQGAIIAAEMAH